MNNGSYGGALANSAPQNVGSSTSNHARIASKNLITALKSDSDGTFLGPKTLLIQSTLLFADQVYLRIIEIMTGPMRAF